MAYRKLPPDAYEKVPFSWRINLGNYGQRFYSTNKFGYNAAVGTSYEDIWSPGGTISFLTSADTMDIVSSDAADKGTPTAGTGMRTMRLIGLDGNYNVVSEDVTLNGTTTVTTTQSFLRVYRAFGLTVGSNGTNVGTISITDNGGSSTQAEIAADQGQNEMAIYTVRAGYYGLITEYNFSVGGADSAEVEIVTQELNGCQRSRSHQNLGTGESIIQNLNAGSPILIPEKTDIKVRAKKTGAGGSTTVSASFSIFEIKQEEVNP